MSIQGVEILEIDIAIAATELGSVDLRPEMLFKGVLAIKDAVTLGAEAVPGTRAVVLQNVIALAFLSTIIAELDSNRVLESQLVLAITSTFMRGEVSTSPSMFFQVGFVSVSTTAETAEVEAQVARHGVF
jgi:hypothetical protein